MPPLEITKNSCGCQRNRARTWLWDPVDIQQPKATVVRDRVRREPLLGEDVREGLRAQFRGAPRMLSGTKSESCNPAGIRQGLYRIVYPFIIKDIFSIGMYNTSSDCFLAPENSSWVRIARRGRGPEAVCAQVEARRVRRVDDRRDDERGLLPGVVVRRAGLPGNRRSRPLSALRAHTKPPYKTDLLWRTLRVLNRPRWAGGPRVKKTTR